MDSLEPLSHITRDFETDLDTLARYVLSIASNTAQSPWIIWQMMTAAETLKVLNWDTNPETEKVKTYLSALEQHMNGELAQQFQAALSQYFLTSAPPPTHPHTLHLTNAQLQLIAKACELMTRLHLGQLREVADLLMRRLPSIDQYQALKEELFKLESVVPQYGISSLGLHEDAKTSYDLWTAIQYKFALKQRPTSRQTIASPLHVSSQPLPIVVVSQPD